MAIMSMPQGRVADAHLITCEPWFTIMNPIDVVESATFKRWIRDLRNRSAVARINARLRNVSLGNFGDTGSVGGGIHEMRLHHGPGYRLYFLREGAKVVVLCGGDKGTQQGDIERARRLALDWR